MHGSKRTPTASEHGSATEPHRRLGPTTSDQSPFSLVGRRILITGASRGIGWAISQAVALAGGHVVLSSRDETALARRAETLREAGHAADFAAFDASTETGASEGFATVTQQFGPINVLVNNAGVGMRKPMATTTMAEFDMVMHTNLRGPYVLIQRAAAHMAASGKGGAIINIGSALSILGRENAALYSASKHALAGLTKSLARELAPDGIRINMVCPGYVDTEMMTAQRADDAFNKAVCARTPLGRWARPDEIGGAVVFLASSASSYVTGHLLAVDGGMTVNV